MILSVLALVAIAYVSIAVSSTTGDTGNRVAVGAGGRRLAHREFFAGFSVGAIRFGQFGARGFRR